MSTASDRVWFITGCSTGFGRVLAERLIARGTRVVVTARDPAKIADIVAGHEDRALALALDVVDGASLAGAVAAAEARFGAVDVLVNNAGYGYGATAEEGVDAEIRAQFETNVFGLFAMTRAVLPGMRARRRGHIINITSVAGLLGYPGVGYYAASKHAVEGFSDSLSAEVAPLGIAVTCIEPGPFRTDWGGRSLHVTETAIDDYRATAGARVAAISAGSGKQAGDPARAADIMMAVVEMAKPPRHLVLGAIGFENVTKRMQARLDEIVSQRDTSLAADFPKA